ncbi:MAG: cadherin-like domain-containing protein [Acidimicrobiia bacterium]|nr:cadherin-like domain-containing protein [Acidimicrobiia bacterium]NNL12977.1 cadherin-like domain-containing protein [Acidimicrobiia bacterium]
MVNPDGTVTYTPDADFFGADSFSYTASDGVASVAGSVTVTVTDVNDPPTAPGVLALEAAPGDVPPPVAIDDPEGDVVTVTVVDGTLPPGLTLNADGTWSGEATEQGTFVFAVEICDDAGACTGSVLSISIALLPATGVSAAFLARLGLIFVLFGWAVLRFINPIAPATTRR